MALFAARKDPGSRTQKTQLFCSTKAPLLSHTATLMRELHSIRPRKVHPGLRRRRNHSQLKPAWLSPAGPDTTGIQSPASGSAPINHRLIQQTSSRSQGEAFLGNALHRGNSVSVAGEGNQSRGFAARSFARGPWATGTAESARRPWCNGGKSPPTRSE